MKVIVIFHAKHLSGTMLRHRVCRPFAPNGASSVFADSENLAEGAIHLPRGNKIKGGAPARASALVGERLSVVDVGDNAEIADFALVGQKDAPP